MQAGIGEPLVIESVQVEDIKFSAAYENSIEEKQQKRQQELAQATAAAQAADAEAQAIQVKGDAEAAVIANRGKALRDNPGVVALIQAEKWDGALPNTMSPNSTVPFLDLNPPTQTGRQ